MDTVVTNRGVAKGQVCCSVEIPNYLFLHKYFWGFGSGLFLKRFSPLAQNQLENYFNEKRKKRKGAWHCLIEILAILRMVLPWKRACLCVHFSPSAPANIGVGDALDFNQLWNALWIFTNPAFSCERCICCCVEHKARALPVNPYPLVICSLALLLWLPAYS